MRLQKLRWRCVPTNGVIGSDSPGNIINVIRRALGYIDVRLVEHGARVAFIASQIVARLPRNKDFDSDRLFMLCMLHDIGAYKTEEINRMLEFESKTTYGHSAYGSLFLKYTTPLSDYAEAILYHHTPYILMLDKSGIEYEYAQIIHLADRIDVLAVDPAQFSPEEVILSASGSMFNPEYVDAFLWANEGGYVINSIRSGEYARDVDKTIRELRVSENEVLSYLNMLILAIDFTSPYTVTHTASTMTAALELGKRLDLNEKQLDTLRLGALLHDIGKISTPRGILEKPGKLDDDETAVMRDHVVKTDEILRGIVSDDVRLLSSRHHEKLNGTGYPLGLTADDLTLSERILAVADIISALLGKRSYKDVFPKPRVIAIIQSMSDKGELDKRATTTFIDNYDEIYYALQISNNSINTLYNLIRNEYALLQFT